MSRQLLWKNYKSHAKLIITDASASEDGIRAILLINGLIYEIIIDFNFY